MSIATQENIAHIHQDVGKITHPLIPNYTKLKIPLLDVHSAT